jgi:APA family basic amino acid/polyamine antiporter
LGQQTKPTIFARNATGLVREISAIGVFAWAVAYFPWLSSWAGIFWVTPSYYQNVNYYASLAVWAVIAIVIVLLYWQMTVIMPRSGGDYIFVSRTLNPLVGFVAGFFFLVAIIASAGSGPYWAFAEAGSQLGFAGKVLNNSFMASLGNSYTPFGLSPATNLMFGIGLVLLALGATATLIGGRVFRYIIYAFFSYAFITLLVVVGIFLSTSHSGFVSAYNANAASFTNTTANIFAQAASKGYTPGANLASLSAVIPLLFVSIGPYPVMQMVGGEIKNPRKSLLYGLVGAELLSIAVWFGMTYLLDRVVSISFIEAWTVAPCCGAGFAPVPTIFASAIAPNAFLAWFIFGGLFVSNIGWSWLGFVFLSRLLLSWSFDGMISTKFAHVSERFRTPTYAVALVCALAVVPMYLEFYTSFLTTQVNSIFLLSIVWILTSIAAIVLPYRKKSMYQSAGGGKKNTLGVPSLSLLGVIGVIVFGYLAYNSVTNPAIGPFALRAQITLLGIFVVAITIYAASYLHNKRRNLNINAIFNELPPE